MILKLENKDIIISSIKKYANDINMDYLEILELFYKIITKSEKDSTKLDNYVFTLKDILKKETIWETEEELFHVISFEIDKIYTDLVMNNTDENSIKSVFEFLDNNYLDLFKNYYMKNNSISEEDYEECVLSVYNNFSLEREVGDILVGKWLDMNIIN